jgi:amino acid adenylation domain-containing protein
MGPYQQPLWLDYRLYPERRSAWVVRAYQVDGSLDQGRLREALEQLQRRHWSLTAAVTGSGLLEASGQGIPLQVWHCDGDPWPEVATFCRDKLPIFRLEEGKLFRVYAAVGPTHFALVLACHHILVDLDSLGLLECELDSLYCSPTAQLEEVISVAAAYARQHRELEQRKPQLLQFWQRQLGDLPPPVPLPWARGARGLGNNTGSVGGLIRRNLPPELTTRIWQSAKDSGSTPYQWLLAGWLVLLAHYQQQTDIHLGTLVSLRTTPAQRRVLGYCQNLVVLRVDLASSKTFADVLRKTQGEVARAMQQRDLPMHDLLRTLGGRREHGSLFSSLFALIDDSPPETFLGGRLRQRQSMDYAGAAFDCSCFFIADSKSPALAIEYNSALYAPEDIARTLDHYQQILVQCLASSEHPQARDWRRYRLVSEADYRAAEQEWQRLTAAAATEECLHHGFGRMAETKPDHIAVVWNEGGQRLQLDYRQLSRRANAVAGFLATLDPVREAPVAVVARWHPDSIAAMVGTLRAGCAYLPVDPDYPPARIAHMLRDSGCRIVLTMEDIALPGELQVRCFPLDVVIGRDPDGVAKPQHQGDDPGGLAYVIYTSGSSGPPKGVMVEHRAAVYSTRERSRVYAQWPPEKFLLLSSIAFDSAVAGLWWTLSSGGTLYLTSPAMIREADRLGAMIQRESITHTLCLPSLWRDIGRMARSFQSLRLVIVAGEACDSRVVQQHFTTAPQAALFNEYGPTEMTVWSSWHRLTPEVSDPVPIGEPLLQTQALVIDRWGNLVPDGLTGELYLAGAGIARGYIGNGAGSAKSGFGEHPLDPAARAYRTGDRVWRDQRGRLVFEGRFDEQVKFRGFRIAIESVETSLQGASDTPIAVLPFTGESLETLLEQLPEDEARAMLARYQPAPASTGD